MIITARIPSRVPLRHQFTKKFGNKHAMFKNKGVVVSMDVFFVQQPRGTYLAACKTGYSCYDTF
jgi:hypothetical protein